MFAWAQNFLLYKNLMKFINTETVDGIMKTIKRSKKINLADIVDGSSIASQKIVPPEISCVWNLLFNQ